MKEHKQATFVFLAFGDHPISPSAKLTPANLKPGAILALFSQNLLTSPLCLDLNGLQAGTRFAQAIGREIHREAQ